jgi:N-acetylmuramoyl-L-alanine amidase
MKIQARLTEKVEREDRGVKQAGFWVLFNTTMPGVLVETGFISNSSEEKILNTPEGQDRVAMAISRACIDYINEVDARSGGITPADFNTGNAATDSKRDNAGTIYFRVQVSASSSRCRDLLSDFKGLTDIAEICEQNRYKYTTGNFTSFTDAVKHRKKIEAIYPDAFVIAVKDNKIVPLQQALEETKARK